MPSANTGFLKRSTEMGLQMSGWNCLPGTKTAESRLQSAFGQSPSQQRQATGWRQDVLPAMLIHRGDEGFA